MTRTTSVLFLLPAFLLGAACGGDSSNDAGHDASTPVDASTDTGNNGDTGNTGDSSPSDGSTACANEVFTATLTGAEEVPPVTTTATGTATFTLNATCDMVTYTVTHTVTGANMAHIHAGAIGVAGPVVIGLATDATSATSPITGTAAITADQVATMQAGGYYANVHSTANPGGEIRGQITPSL